MATPQQNPTFPEKYMIDFAMIIANLREHSPGTAGFVEAQLDRIFLKADRSFDIRKFHRVIDKVNLNTKY